MNTPTPQLEELMEQVLQRKPMALEGFYKELFRSILVVVDRTQRAHLSDQPEYPNDFFGTLAIKDKQRVVLPFFSRASLIEDWAGTNLNYREITAPILFDLIPDGWWACLNPGTEVEKEFSPWEIQQLRSGEASIREIVAELAGANEEVDFNLEALQPTAYAALFNAIADFGSSHRSCEKIFGAREFSADRDGGQTSRVLIGLLHSETDSKRASNLVIALGDTARRAMIGDELVRVVSQGPNQNEAVISALRLTTPIYDRSTSAGLWKKLLAFFGR